MKMGAPSTDTNNLSKVIDGDCFNIHPPPAVPDSLISIPGTALGGRVRSLDFDPRMLSTHTAMVGGIGTGKSNLFYHLISQVRSSMTHKDIAIVFDTKGDFLKLFGQDGDIVISNDIQMSPESGADYWNLFDEIDESDPESSIREICASLFKDSVERTNNPFFPNAASDLFCALVSIFYENFKKQESREPTNQDLVSFIRNTTPENLLDTLRSYRKYNSVASHISDPESGQSRGVIAEMNAVVNRLLIGNFAKVGHISMSRLVKERGGRTVFIEYDIRSGEMLTPIYSLLVDLALKQALSSTGDHHGSVYLFVDEFKLLPNLQHIDDAVNFGRSLGMKVFVALQSITQIYDSYGEMRAKSILSGFLNCMFFNVNNAESRDFIKARFGRCLRKVTYGQNKEYVFVDDVVKDKDITRLATGEMIVGLQNREPFVFKADEWAP